MLPTGPAVSGGSDNLEENRHVQHQVPRCPLAIICAVSRALRKAHVPRQDIVAFQTEAMSGDYDKVLQTALSWVTVR